MYRTDDVAVNDTVEFDVMSPCSGRRRHVLYLRYEAGTGSLRLINVGLSNVEEGGSAIIGPEMLNVIVTNGQQHRRNFKFSVTSPPRHGVLQLINVTNVLYVFKKIFPTFSTFLFYARELA